MTHPTEQNIIIEDVLIAGLAALLPSLGRLIAESDHPVAVRLRDVRPTEWPTESVERELLKVLTDGSPDTKPGA